ncbi:hypothetical protein N9V27_01250 [bacterium]|jgi:hypothetical protein|nr:hypothetical protein [bacterium]
MFETFFKSLVNRSWLSNSDNGRQEDLIRFCRTEYGKEWRSAYSNMMDHKNKGNQRVVK